MSIFSTRIEVVPCACLSLYCFPYLKEERREGERERHQNSAHSDVDVETNKNQFAKEANQSVSQTDLLAKVAILLALGKSSMKREDIPDEI